MNEFKYTPGKWIIDSEKPGIVRMNDYFRIEQIATAENLRDNMTLDELETEGEANAKLIAASPDIIKALQLISPIIDIFINQTPSGLERIKLCDINIIVKSAIEKATK